MTKVTGLVYVGFNSRVAALDKRTGEKLWDWKTKSGTGYVAVLLDGELLFASVNGYTYCLDARTGEERWHNPLQGMGIGVPCIASSAGQSLPSHIGEAAAAQGRQASRRSTN